MIVSSDDALNAGDVSHGELTDVERVGHGIALRVIRAATLSEYRAWCVEQCGDPNVSLIPRRFYYEVELLD